MDLLQNHQFVTGKAKSNSTSAEAMKMPPACKSYVTVHDAIPTKIMTMLRELGLQLDWATLGATMESGRKIAAVVCPK